MKVDVIFHHVVKAGPESHCSTEQYHFFSKRFVDSYLKFPPQIEHRLHICCSEAPGENEQSIFSQLCKTSIRNQKGEEVAIVFHGSLTEFTKGIQLHTYRGHGIDMGGTQMLADQLDSDFILALNNTCYFTRDGWLERFVDARTKYGPGLYGNCATMERCPAAGENCPFPNPHVRTEAFAFSPDMMRRYPFRAVNRNTAWAIESGGNSFSKFHQKMGLPVMHVGWGGETPVCGFPMQLPRDTFRNGFRNGDQSNLVIHDRHQDLFESADPKEKQDMTRATWGI